MQRAWLDEKTYACVREENQHSWRWRAAFLAVFALFGATVVHGQAAAKPKVVVIVTEDDLPCPWAKVTIHAQGRVEGWPEGKTKIVLTADDKGRVTTTLGAGVYRVAAVDSIGSRLPASARFTIKLEQSKLVKIRLELQYWDCAHVTCEL